MPHSHEHHHDHSHEHSHEHHGHQHHCHSHAKAGEQGRLSRVFVLTAAYMLCELWGGVASGSLALLADAGHMFGDSMVLGLALSAAWVARRKPSDTRTFGYDRAEVLAALLNACFLVLIACVICYEALLRFGSPVAIKGNILLFVAAGGLLVNGVSAWPLHKDQQHSLNVRGAYLHVLSDLAGSVAAILAGVFIIAFGWLWADAVMGILVSLLILVNALGLLKEALDILLEGAPAHIHVHAVEESLLGREDVLAVHELHVWSVNTGKVVLTAHIVLKPGAFGAQTLSSIQQRIKEEFGLSHVTLQLEEG